jgi:WD40 repeat protein/tetratricopeptide (TPR) repeat protein
MIAGLAAVLVLAVLACAAALVANQRATTLADIARQNEAKAQQNAQRAKQSQQETARALAVVASQKAAVEGSLSKAEAAERSARAAEESGRKLLYTTDMQLVPFIWNDPQATSAQLRTRLSAHVPDEEKMKDEGRRMNKTENGSDSSFILHPSSFRKPDLRGFEWYYYQHLLDHGAAVFLAHEAPVLDAVFTPDGPLVTLDQTGQLRRWDLETRAEDEASRRDLPGRASTRSRVLSPDGRLAAVALGNTAQVLDTSTGKERFSIDSIGQSFQGLIFTRSGDRLVIVDDNIRWCDAQSGAVIASVDRKPDGPRSLALSADGLTLAVVGLGRSGNQFSIFRLDPTAKTATPLAKDVRTAGSTNVSALSPDGQRIVVSASYYTAPLLVFDTATGRLIAEQPPAHSSPLVAMAFSGDGAMLATADAQGTIKIWTDVEHLNSKSAALLTLKGHQGAIKSVHFSIDGKRLVTASADQTARVWDLENSGASIRPLERSGLFSDARFSADGQLIATSGIDGVRLWDAANGRLVRQLPARDRAGRSSLSVAFSPTDSRLLAVGGDSYPALWDLDAGTELARLTGAADLPDSRLDVTSGRVTLTAFSPDGKYLVAAFFSSSPSGSERSYFLKVWEVATRRLIHRLKAHMSYCYALDFTKDAALLASGSADGTAIIWSTATWKETQTLRNPDHDDQRGFSRSLVGDVAFSPDGKTLAMASYGGNLHLFDVATGKLLETLKGHADAVHAVEFSPDGRTLASGSSDQTVRLWNVPTRRELMQLDPGSIELGPVYTLAFSPNGTQLLTAGLGSAALWSTAPIVWNDSDRAAEKLRHLLQSNADFRSRIRMFSENLRLHEALEKLDAQDVRVQAALAATQANGQASRQAWREAALAFDRLAAADPTAPEAWLRTPGLLRLATALLHQNRPAAAALLLQGGASRRIQDGLPAIEQSGLGFAYAVTRSSVRVTELLPEYPGSRAGLRVGDTIEKVNDTELNTESLPKLGDLLAGDAGTKVRLTVRHSGSQKPEVIELTRERFLHDPATGALLHPLREAVNDRLAQEPRNPGLLELRAELAGQWSDGKAQVADYTAALEALSHQEPEANASDLRRLYRRRGDAYVAVKQWQEAVDDYARGITTATTDDAILANQALAQANAYLEREPAAGSTTKRSAARLAAMKLTDPWQKLAAKYRLEGDQQAIDRLIERRPELAGPIGDLFTQGEDEDKDWRRAIALYTRGIAADATDLELLAKRARAHEALHDWDAAAADWSRAASGTPEGARWLAEFARRLAAAGQVPLAKGQFEKAQALYQRALEADPDDELVASGLAQVLLDQHKQENPARWVVLTPVEMKTETGARMELQEDGSVFVHQNQPFQDDTYSLVFPTEGKGITGLRLEVLADSRLPGGGPGWGTTNGNFWLNEVTLEAAPPGSPDRAKAIPLRTAWADFSQVDYGGPGVQGAVDGDVRRAVDGKAGTGWAVYPEVNRDHTAVFELAEEIGGGPTSQLTVRLIHQRFKQNQNLGNLGRFRLSVSGSPAPLDWERKHAAATNLADPWHRLAAAYHVIGNQPALDELLRHHPAAEFGIAQLYVAAGRTREAVALLARASAANPQDTTLSLRVAALQAWYGQEKELAATRQRILVFAQGTSDVFAPDRAAKACSILPTTDKAVREAALTFGRKAVKSGQYPEWSLLALGMAEYRDGNDAAAVETLQKAAMAGLNNPQVTGISAFYRAMSLFRQGKTDEARELVIAAAAAMKPPPADLENPLAGNTTHDDLIRWLACKEAKAMIPFDAPPTAPAQPDGK